MSRTIVNEIAPDVFRISTFIPEFNLGFNQFLVKDEQPLLYHTGMRGLFPAVKTAVTEVLDPASIRWIGFSHFEADECGALNEWLETAPRAEAACGMVAALVNVNDFAVRPARVLQDGEVLETGKRRFRYRATPQVPHAWDAGMLFEETTRALFCSDLFHQVGEREPVTRESIVGRFREALVEYNAGPFAHYLPYTPRTESILTGLADLKPDVILPMHGSAFQGNGEQAIREMAKMLGNILGGLP